jgi:hypothetical protein
MNNDINGDISRSQSIRTTEVPTARTASRTNEFFEDGASEYLREEDAEELVRLPDLALRVGVFSNIWDCASGGINDPIADAGFVGMIDEAAIIAEAITLRQGLNNSINFEELFVLCTSVLCWYNWILLAQGNLEFE